MPSLPFNPTLPPDNLELDDEEREKIREQKGNDALRRTLEHGAPETGLGDDFKFEQKDTVTALTSLGAKND